jgi:integrase
MTKRLTDAGIARLKPRTERYTVPDPELRGGYVRITPNGAKTYVIITRTHGKQIWHTVGACDAHSVDELREQARVALKRIKQGEPAKEPVPTKALTFRDVAENYFTRVVDAEAHRTADESKRVMSRYVYPAWADRPFVSLKRSDLSVLLDRLQDEHGARQADVALSGIRRVATWHATRDDNYISPFDLRGLKRDKAQPRNRILSDAELQIVWAASANTRLGALVRLLLLTAQRKSVVHEMRWSHLVDGVWHIPMSAREKTNGGILALPDLALETINALPRFAGSDFVFAGSHSKSGCMDISVSGPDFCASLSIPHFTLHDLRRTARSLLSRCGVAHDTSERVLGHQVGSSISRTYDRHQYVTEKKIALAKLARLIETIISGDTDDSRVVQFTKVN